MDPKKKKKLKDSGWNIGSAADFLSLTPHEAAYIELKLSLGWHLRALRNQSQLTQVQLAKRIHSSQSRVAKMEAGDPSVSLDLMIRTLLAMGATTKDVARYIRQPAKSTPS